MKRALLLLLGAAALALPSHVFAQASSTQKPAAPAPATAKPAAAAPASGRVVEIEANDQMKFSKTTIDAKPGETFTVRLKNVGTMPKAVMGHNFVLLKASAKADTFANEALAAGPAANYIPAARKGDIIASSPLIGPGETVNVVVKVPAAAGNYPYLCSFLGHYASGMKGMLVVK